MGCQHHTHSCSELRFLLLKVLLWAVPNGRNDVSHLAALAIKLVQQLEALCVTLPAWRSPVRVVILRLGCKADSLTTSAPV